ncbi:MAG: helicase associated domain-containing protein, partial [Bacilli bacterium]|nr:helicase associated domain-containing protein [Bacilli bacterium]
NTSKEEMIEKLLSPLIIDLTCNYEWIKELEAHLKNRLKENTGRKNNTYQRRKLIDASFDIEVENIDLFSSLMDLKNRLNNSWNRMYEYACIYYEHHGNLEVPQKFKTNNGWEEDKTGKINLGLWIFRQRSGVLPESERGRLLSQIGMRFENKNSTLCWEEMYGYARIYYEHHKDLEIPQKFKTSNGWEEDEAGKINLGSWITYQRQNTLLESARGQLLSQIGMRFENKISTLSWEEMYEYACIYYEHHGNLEVPQRFKTSNGFEYEEQGKIKLGAWIARQRSSVLSDSKRGQLLLKIGMRFENKKSTLSWEEMYEYARIYYEHHKSLEIPRNFKTNNGFEYDEKGSVNLGIWIASQKQLYQKKEMSEEQIILLENIGIKWMSEKVDNKLQLEEITEKNTRKKQIELLNRTKSLLNHIGNQDFGSKEDVDRVNQKFVDELNRKSR